MSEKPGLPTGILVGAVLSAALTGMLFLVHRLAGLAFPPFDVFDWSARALPGGLVTFGIDAMVGAIRGVGAGGISDVAKTAEQALALTGFVAGGALAAGVLYLMLRRAGGAAIGSGLGLGALGAVPLVAIGFALDRMTAVGAAWILVALLLWGAALGWVHRRLSVPLTRRVGSVHAERVSRRTFLLRVGGASAAITVVGAVVGSRLGRGGTRAAASGPAWSATHRLPNADAGVVPAPGTRAELTPVPDHYRIDINTRSPVVNGDSWRLRITGLVDRPAALTLDEMRAYEPVHRFITLACISNPIAGDLIGTTRWTGVPLARLLEDAGLRPDATHLRIRSADGFHETLALDLVRADDRIMLAYDWDGLPLPTEHGYPLRIYIPDRYGMKQPKWIESIEAVPQYEDGYWVRRGWSREARMNATSVIDTVGGNMMLGGDEPVTIAIGGIARAGVRGVSRVEIRVDDGAWQSAELREPLSDLTWVLWRFEWPFQSGDHTFTVRCFEGDGTPQVAERSPVRPDGATGLHRENVML